MIDGISLSAVWLPLLIMTAWTTLFLAASSFLFRWHKS